MHSRNHRCRGKAIRITYVGCMFVALGIQHAKGKCYIILSSAACLALPRFSTLRQRRHDIREKKLNMKCVFLTFSKTVCPKTFLTLRRIQRDTIINALRSSCKVPVILVTF